MGVRSLWPFISVKLHETRKAPKRKKHIKYKIGKNKFQNLIFYKMGGVRT